MLNVRLWETAVYLAVACYVFIDVSLCCPFTHEILDGIWDLVGSVFEGLPTYFFTDFSCCQ